MTTAIEITDEIAQLHRTVATLRKVNVTLCDAAKRREKAVSDQLLVLAHAHAAFFDIAAGSDINGGGALNEMERRLWAATAARARAAMLLIETGASAPTNLRAVG